MDRIDKLKEFADNIKKLAEGGYIFNMTDGTKNEESEDVTGYSLFEDSPSVELETELITPPSDAEEPSSGLTWELLFSQVQGGGTTSLSLGSLSNDDNTAFINLMRSYYKKRGYNDDVALMLASKEAHETGYGKHPVGDFNYGNIKKGSSWKGKTKVGKDNLLGNRDEYRSYDSLDLYVDDADRLYRRYYKLNNDTTGEQALSLFVQGGYAEDPEWAKNIRKIYNKYNV